MYIQDGVGGGSLQDGHGGDLNCKKMVAPCETGIVAILLQDGGGGGSL